MSSLNSRTHATMGRNTAAHILAGIQVGTLRVVRASGHPYARATKGLCPRMDLYDNPRFPDIVATFELPGVKLSDLSITVKEGVLEIVGQRQRSYRSDLRRLHPSLHATDATSVSESDVDIRHWRCRELRYGVFRRSLQLPTGIEQSAISATMMEGLLTVSWPRAATPSQAPADVGGSDSESHDEIESEFEPESESESESK